VFAGAQKNLGTSGLTFVVINEAVLDKVRSNLNRDKIGVPLMMDWSK
jgi:phosphoserine aminotransferase